MTRKEAAKLQRMEDLKYYPDTIAEAFRAFGNAVNVEVVQKIAEQLLAVKWEDKLWKRNWILDLIQAYIQLTVD